MGHIADTLRDVPRTQPSMIILDIQNAASIAAFLSVLGKNGILSKVNTEMNRTTPIEPRSGCVASAMAIIGAKWTALILRDLASGPKRYSELQQNINVNPRTLSQRLENLICENIVAQTEQKAYQLTSKGSDLLPIIEQMASWGNKYTISDIK